MKNFIIIKNKISSFVKKIEVSGDKSISIRCVLLASQAIGKSSIKNLLESQDVIDSLNAIKKLGINYKKRKNTYDIMVVVLMVFIRVKILKFMQAIQGLLQD